MTNNSIWGSICSRENIMNKDKIILGNEPYCLRLPLETKWYKMTEERIKPEDYRLITPYWCNRLLLYGGKSLSKSKWSKKFFGFQPVIGDILSRYTNAGGMTFKPFTQNIMTLGYPKSDDEERILKLEHKGIEIRTGNPEWGAESSKVYFVIKHGEVIK